MNDSWAGGLFEGEGYFTINRSHRKNPQLVVGLEMTDRDTVDRFHEWAQCGTRFERELKSGKTLYRWISQSNKNAITLIERLWPYLGQRRRQQAERILDAAASLVS